MALWPTIVLKKYLLFVILSDPFCNELPYVFTERCWDNLFFITIFCEDARTVAKFQRTHEYTIKERFVLLSIVLLGQFHSQNVQLSIACCRVHIRDLLNLVRRPCGKFLWNSLSRHTYWGKFRLKTFSLFYLNFNFRKIYFYDLVCCNGGHS